MGQGRPDDARGYLDPLLYGVLADGADPDELVGAAHLLCDIYLGLPELTEEAWGGVAMNGGVIYDVLVGAMMHLARSERADEGFVLSQRWKTPLFARPVLDRLQTTVTGRQELELTGVFSAMDTLKHAVASLIASTSHEETGRAVVGIRNASGLVREALDRRSLADPVQAWKLGRISYPAELIDALPDRGGAVCLVDLMCSAGGMFVHLVGRHEGGVEVSARMSEVFGMEHVLECAGVYRTYLVDRVDPDRTSRALDHVCQILHDRLWCHVAKWIGAEGFTQIILIPDPWTRGLPHHLSKVCGKEVTVAPDVPVVRRERLADLFPLEVAPSVQSVAITHWQLRPRSLGKLVMVGNPNGDLLGAAWSAHHLAERLPDDLRYVSLVDEAATKQAFLEEVEGAPLIVFNGHGVFEAKHPPASRIRLADADLTLAEMLDGRGVVPGAVYVLSCCDLGTGTPGETLQGFAVPGALLAGGAACVMAAMWEMEDVSFGYLTDRFLHHLGFPGFRPSAALYRAMNDVKAWTREGVVAHVEDMVAWMEAEGYDRTRREDHRYMTGFLEWARRDAPDHPFEDPTYWGGAVVYGCGWSGLRGGVHQSADSLPRQLEVLTGRKPERVAALIRDGQLATARSEIDAWLAWAHGPERIPPLRLQAELMERGGLDPRAVVNLYRRLELMARAHGDDEVADHAVREIERVRRG